MHYSDNTCRAHALIARGRRIAGGRTMLERSELGKTRFARKVSVRLKGGKVDEFARLMQSEILGWLQQQEGFLDLITLASPDQNEVTTISFWDHEMNAQAAEVRAYPEALHALAELLDGPPYVKTFEVVGSTVAGHDGVSGDEKDFETDAGSGAVWLTR